MKTRFLPFFLALSGVTIVFASPPAEKPPSAPLLAAAPASSQWTVTYKSKVPEKKDVSSAKLRERKLRQRYSPLVLSTHTIKAPGKRVIYTEYEAGLKSEAWVVGGYIYELPYRDDANMRIETRGQSDFPELSWVSAATFRGTVEVKKQKFYLYKTDAPATPAPAATTPAHEPTEPVDNPTAPSVRQVYVDVETKLPVKMETDTTEMTYQFDAAPPTFPEMNEQVAEQLKSSK